MGPPPREFKTVDLMRRVAVITPSMVKLANHPVRHPVAVFNPALFLGDSELLILARVVLGYYKYVSAIAEFRLDLNDVLEGEVPEEIEARITVVPRDWFDIWGAEDPRGTVVEGDKYIVYTGRTKHYFSGAHEKTLPVIAREMENGEWVKTGIVRHPERDKVVSDKDAFVVKEGEHYLLFHRPHYGGKDFRTVISVVRGLEGDVVVDGTKELLRPELFEEKIGWGTPPIEIGGGKLLIILHGVDRHIKAYRAFATLIRIKGGDAEVVGISRTYITEPSEPYEMYGDRPMVVFPCGAVKIDDNVIIAYGAADQVIGLGVLDLSEVMDLITDFSN